jgi:hypothetical protein
MTGETTITEPGLWNNFLQCRIPSQLSSKYRLLIVFCIKTSYNGERGNDVSEKHTPLSLPVIFCMRVKPGR